jgi:hypothetical protein
MIYFIYTISIPNTDYLYVGSTKNFNKRVAEHNRNIYCDETHKVYKYKLYQTIRNDGDFNCEYKILENYECENKDKAKIREKYWLDELCPDFKQNNLSLNSIEPICFLTKQERDKLYHETHKQERKIYVENNKEHIQQTAKKYYETNQDDILIKAKSYRENNKDKIKQSNDTYSNLEPILCACGETYTYKHKSRHIASEKHKLGTDPEYKLQKETELKLKRDEAKKRNAIYKKEWYDANKNK